LPPGDNYCHQVTTQLQLINIIIIINEFFVTTMKTSIKELNVSNKTVKSVMGIEIISKIFN